MSDTPNLTIGAFSSQSRLSIRMLRHYDEQGLLPPADVDPHTGYRRYSTTQLADAARIRHLRDVGFTVSAIAAVLAARGSAAYTQALVLQRDVLMEELRVAQHRVDRINRLIQNEGQDMNEITVSRKHIPAQTIAAVRGIIPTHAEEEPLWAQLMPALAAQGITPTGPGGVIEHDGEFRERDVDESAWVPVAPGTTAEAPIVIHELPARDAVVAHIVGPYSLITEAHERIHAFAAEHGLTLASPGTDAPIADCDWNVYLASCETDGPGTTPVTDVCVPIA